MKLSAIDKTRDASVDFGEGDVLNVKYSAAALTPRLESELAAATTSNQMAGLLCALVKEWDLTEDDGETTVPLTVDRLQDVPLIVLSTTVKAVALDISKNVRAEGNS